MSDIVAVVQRSHAAIQAVDSRIRMVGLAECCGTSIVRNLMDNYNGAQYLGGLTYHRYVSSDFSSGIQRGDTPNHGFSIENYPDAEARVLVFDNLSSRSPVARITASGSPLSFSYSIPTNSSFTFKIMPRAPSAPSLGPQGIAVLLLVLLYSTLCLLSRRDAARLQG